MKIIVLALLMILVAKVAAAEETMVVLDGKLIPESQLMPETLKAVKYDTITLYTNEDCAACIVLEKRLTALGIAFVSAAASTDSTIKQTPTLVLMLKGKEVKRLVGLLPSKDILAFLGK